MLTSQRTNKRNITPGTARSELAKRKLAERDLMYFCEYVDPDYHRYRHHIFLADKLMQVKHFERDTRS